MSATFDGIGCPSLDLDPYSDEFLGDPYPFHTRIREAGAVVYLPRHATYAMARHAEVQATLADWQTFISSAGVGVDDLRKTAVWRPPSPILETDPPLHDRRRAVLNRAVSAAAIRRLREAFAREAEALAERLVRRRRIDAVADLAEAFPLLVLPDAIGLSREGRENLLPYGNMIFNSFGPRNELFLRSTTNGAPVVDWIMAQSNRDRLAPEGLAADIFAAADAGEIAPEEAGALVRSLLTAGFDTTVTAIGNGIHAFTNNPDQWELLCREPSLNRPAFDEILRFESPVQTFFRTAARDAVVAGVTIPADAKVLLFLGGANRDPRKWPDAERFDIRRRPIGHVAFGTGIHVCVGQFVARLEAEVIFEALAKRVARIEPAGPPRRKLNNTLRALASLPVELVPRS
jgi:cytochrome P450